jgi:hypothetical protein
MTKEPSTPPTELSTPEDRLQHDIDELERGMGWKGVVKWILILGVAAAAVGAFYKYAPKPEAKKTPKMTAKGGMVLDTLEPQNGKLSAAPSRFRWEGVTNRSDYTFKLMAKGDPIPLADRVVRDANVELQPLEASRLKAGGSYIWEAQARGPDGKILGTARGYFDL